ncbi:MAG: hypothetical protein ACHQ0J_06055 [Candidatus Dormibacterales bacterium]
MTKRAEQSTRDRAIWIVRVATLGGLTSALGLTWAFSNLAEAYFSGKQPAPPAPPAVPAAATPVQVARQVITTVVHHPYSGGYVGSTSGGGAAAAPASSGGSAPAAAPAPPPPPACVSTPSKPC